MTTKINKLLMHGFKSFAKKTELVFHDDFNCVVGPNGSGKSNILDALVFVLGKSSAKALRSEKSANLIYNGGKSKKPSEKAEVSIFFDNAQKAFPYDIPEVKVSRFVKPKGNSVYKINDQTCTRSQVVELLSLAKIDADGHNIILQGDIVHFCQMAGEERRELIEEIAGISIYEDKKNKAMSTLNSVEDKLKEASIVLKERGDYLKELKKERDEALKFNDLNNKLKVSKASHLNKQIERKTEQAKKYEDRLEKHNDVINQHKEKIAELKLSINEKRKEIDGINTEIETKGDKEQGDLNKEVETLRVQVATDKNKIESTKNEIVKLKQRKEQLQDNIKEVKDRIQTIESEKKSTQKEIDVKNKDLQIIETKITTFKAKNKLDDVSGVESEMDKLDKKIEESQKEVLDLRQKQQELIREKDKAEFQINAVDERMEKMLEVEKENKTQILELKSKKEEFKKTTSELNQILNTNSNISAQLGTARGKLNTANDELSRIQSKVNTMRELGGATSEILAQKKNIKGIYGSISELGKVPSKYALALEIAAANRIKSVVVDSDTTAQKCIKFLKEKRLGIANFIPLNKIRSKSIDESSRKYAKESGAVGFAIDLIKFDKKYEKAFSYLFGSTLVVEDLNVARKIGIGNVKMVTVDGDVSETSGMMQGGFREKKNRIGFNQAELDDDLKKYEEQVSDSQSLISRLEQEREETEDKISKLRALKANLDADVIKLEKILHLESDDSDASKKVKKEQEALSEKLDKEILDIGAKISDINFAMADSKTEKQELKDKIAQIRNPVLLAELNTFEEKRSQLKEQLMKLEVTLKNFDTQIKTMLSPETEKTLSIINQHKKEEEEFDANIKTLKEAIINNSKLLKEKEALEEKFMKQFKGLFTKRQALDEEISGVTDKVDAISDKLRESELNVNSNNIEAVRVTTELDGLKKEFEEFEGIELDMKTEEQELKSQIVSFERSLARMDTVNLKSLEMFDIVEKEYDSLTDKKNGLSTEREDVLMLINEIETKKIDLFQKSFNAVNDEFQRIFTDLTTKGAKATLKLENEKDPLAGGVEIKVKISGKKFMDLRSLSGGEKTMTALAFIFAIQEYEPASFYILDEVDAALDKSNAERLAKLVNSYSSKAQYIMISHNDGVISSAKTLYGVSMDTHGISNVVSLKL